jgi:hypothetical protein
MSLPEQLQQSDRLDPLVWKITSVAVIGSFLSQLDATVVNHISDRYASEITNITKNAEISRLRLASSARSTAESRSRKLGWNTHGLPGAFPADRPCVEFG